MDEILGFGFYKISFVLKTNFKGSSQFFALFYDKGAYNIAFFE